MGGEDPLEEGMATLSNILAWRIHVNRRAWWATVCRAMESDMTSDLAHMTACCIYTVQIVAVGTK